MKKESKRQIRYIAKNRSEFDLLWQTLNGLDYEHLAFKLDYNRYSGFTIDLEDNSYVTIKKDSYVFVEKKPYRELDNVLFMLQLESLGEPPSTKRWIFKIWNVDHFNLVYGELSKNGLDFHGVHDSIEQAKGCLNDDVLIYLEVDLDGKCLRWGSGASDDEKPSWTIGCLEATYEELMEGSLPEISEFKMEFTIELNQTYKAIVDESGVHVGCQTFTHAAALELADVIVQNYNRKQKLCTK